MSKQDLRDLLIAAVLVVSSLWLMHHDRQPPKAETYHQVEQAMSR